MAWNDGLAGKALAIAEIDHSPLRIIAGPGTGKTFGLMRRVARLLEQGIQGASIFVSTFTRTAAADLRDALKELATPGADQVRSATLHAYCFSLLRRSEVLELTGRVPRPLLQFEERFLLEDLTGFGGVRERSKRLRAFNAAWARLQSEEPGWPTDPKDREFHGQLIGWLRFHGAMLIGELVPETLRFLRENPQHRPTFAHVLVDEYQDLNRAEQSLLDSISAAGTLTVVGDEDQSIYSFKHAYPQGIANFDAYHPGTHDEQLEECRRCPTWVVQLANELIKQNVGRAARSLHPMPGNPKGEVYQVQWDSMESEAEGLAQFVRSRMQSGSVQPGRVLILATRRQFGYGVRDALNDLGVHAHSFFHEEALDGNPKEMEDSQAQQAFTLLTLLADRDPVALRCWCGFGNGSLRAGAWCRLQGHCETTGQDPWAALEDLESGRLRIPNTKPLVDRFSLLKAGIAQLNGLQGPKLIEVLFPQEVTWSESLRTIALVEGNDDDGPASLRERLRIAITQPELPTDVDYVRVMSLHKSKGLSADLVVVQGCIEGLVPFIDYKAPTSAQEEQLEEQRRLFYVAITRTRGTLVLSSVSSLPRDLAFRIRATVGGYQAGGMTGTITSRFISELGAGKPKALRGDAFLLATGASE